MRIEKRGEFAKAKDGIIYGWAVISTTKNAAGVYEPYIDLQGDYIPDDTLPGVAAEFMSSTRVGKDMHAGDQVADVVFCLPVTEDIAKGLGLDTDRTGLVIGWKPYDKSILDAVANGSRVGFSIGGFVTDSEQKSLAKNAPTDKANQHKRTFRSWKLAEISLVDVPAQEGALVGIVKRGHVLASIAKSRLATDIVDGHQHVVVIYEGDDIWVQSATAEGMECSHSHGIMTGENGELTILMDAGHTHTIAAGQAPVIVVPEGAVLIAARDPNVHSPTTNEVAAKAAAPKSTRSAESNKVNTMKTAEEKLADLQKRNDRLELVAKLSPDIRVHFDSLIGDAQDEFLAKSASERLEIVKVATEVVHTCADGTKIYKRDGELALRFAKQADEAVKIANIEKAAREYVELTKRADTTLAVVKADDGGHIELLHAVESITDKDKREAATKALKALALNTRLGKSAPGIGGSDAPVDGSDADSGDAEDALEKGLVAFCAEKKITKNLWTDGLAQFVKTEKGAALKLALDESLDG